MKLVKNFSLAALLAFVLAVSVTAGENPMPGATATPTPPASRATTASDEVIEESSPSDTEVSDYLFLEALAALLSVY